MQDVRAAEKTLGRVSYQASEKEAASRVFRRSLYAVADIAEGEQFTMQNIRSVRPANGLPPSALPQVLGRKAKTAISRGTPLDWAHIA